MVAVSNGAESKMFHPCPTAEYRLKRLNEIVGFSRPYETIGATPDSEKMMVPTRATILQ